MRIAAVNNTNSFGRVISIQNITKPESTRSSAKELVKVLNHSGATVYSQKEENDIRSFFMDVLEDYNGYDSVMARKTQSGVNVLISGRDAKQFKNMELNHIAKHNKTPQEIELYKTKYDKEITKRLEDGKSGKPESVIKIASVPQNPRKIVSIDYESFEEIRIGKNGKKTVSSKTKPSQTLYQVKYYSKGIDLNG